MTHRLRSSGFWGTAAAAGAVVLVAAAPTLQPAWFVGPAGTLTVLGGVGGASVLAALLLTGWRWARLIAVITLAWTAWTLLSWAPGQSALTFAVSRVGLAAVAAAVAGVLAFSVPVRAYFLRAS